MLPLPMIIGDGLKLGLKYDWGLHYLFSLHKYIARKTSASLNFHLYPIVTYHWFHGMPRTR